MGNWSDQLWILVLLLQTIAAISSNHYFIHGNEVLQEQKERGRATQ